MTTIEFGVRGMPVPQGSGRSFVAGGRAVHVTTSSPLLAWRGAIAKAAQDALGGAPLERGPLAVTLAFRPRPRPASHFLPANSRRPVRVLRPDAPVWFAGKPDGDKLARAALDAMTFVVYEDDDQAVRIVVEKRWPDEGEVPGVDVRVRTLEETPIEDGYYCAVCPHAMHLHSDDGSCPRGVDCAKEARNA